jgi:hypothetical protein
VGDYWTRGSVCMQQVGVESMNETKTSHRVDITPERRKLTLQPRPDRLLCPTCHEPEAEGIILPNLVVRRQK